jgi:arylsulfatase A-like enzyme
MAEVARREGRRTAAFVSNPWLAPGGLARGFGKFDVAQQLECLPAARSARLRTSLTNTALRLGRLDAADRVVPRGIRWIRGGSGAWFLWLHAFDPHLPNRNVRPYDRLFGPPPRYARYEQEVEDIRAGRTEGGAEGRREIESLYHGEVAFTDRAVGTLVRFLERSGELGRTAVVVSADHGEEFWDHGGYGHGHEMFDEVVRVPLLVRPPGGADGRVDGALVALADVAPTALAAAEIPVPEGAFRGADRLAPDAAARAATYGEATLYGAEKKFLRTPRWMLVLRLPEAAPPTDAEGQTGEAPVAGAPAGTPAAAPAPLQLFDLLHDPGETTDLAGADPARTDSLRAVLEAWRAEVGSAGAMAARRLPEGIDAATREQLKALGYLQ